MIGFHPLILAILPGIIVGLVVAVILFFCRQWQTGTSVGIGALLLLLVVRNGHGIENEAWRRTIELNASTNEAALAAIQVDLPADDLNNLWEDEKLSPVGGFQWYGSNRFSAPNGIYFGFRIASVPHVRIQKIRNGWRGIALVRSEADFNALTTRSGLTYSRIGSSGWVTWIL